MPTGNVTSTVAVAGLTMTSAASRTADGVIGQEIALPAGKAGTLSTRTDDDTGVVTLASGHGVTTQDTVDVFWSGGAAYGFAVTNVATDDVTIDLGSGDVLPAQDTVVVVTPRVEIEIDLDGDAIALIAAHCTKRRHIEFTTDADSSLLAVELTALEVWQWINDQGVTNPLASGAVGKIQATCGEASAATLKVGALYDSTP